MQSEKRNIIAAVVIALLFIYMGYAIAACVDENGVLSIVSVMSRLSARLEKPVFLCWNQYTPGGLMYGGMLGIFFGMYFYYTRKEWMFGKEMGSAKWGDVSKLNKKLTNIKRLKREDVPYERILSRNLKMNMSDKVTRRNNNVLLIAGSGVGKTFRVVKPNILSCNGSMMITDPKQELLRDCGEYSA